MLSINFIRENEDAVRKAILDKGVEFNLDELLRIDDKRRELQQGVDAARQEMNETATAVSKTTDAKREKLILRGRQLKKDSAAMEAHLSIVSAKFKEMLLYVPNIPSDDTPVGLDETANVEIERVGAIPKFDFPIRDHIELGLMLDGIDLERGTKVAGFRGYYLKNEIAMLHWATLWHTTKRMREKGYTVMATPVIVKELALIGSGHFPGDREEIYEVEDGGDKERETKYLAGTSEPSLLAYRAGEIINESELPLRLSGLSSCYRREVGGYGKDTKGLYRVHEFSKVEQVIICRDDFDESLPLFEELKANAISILNDFGLPYRVLQMSTGDMGAGKYKMYDIETWMPSRKGYGETHSNSHLTNWQTRRLNIRYKGEDGKMHFPHAMNNTAIASPRILIALLENLQQEDGSVKIPKVLQEYLGFDVIKPK